MVTAKILTSNIFVKTLLYNMSFFNIIDRNNDDIKIITINFHLGSDKTILTLISLQWVNSVFLKITT